MKSVIKTILITLLIAGCASQNGDYNIEIGSNYYIKGDFESAEKELRKALNKELKQCSKKKYYTILGNTYNELELFDSSIVYHRKALDLDPNYVTALVNLGVVYRLTSEFELAEQCYLKAKEINPEDPELYASLGALNIYQGNVELAIENLNMAIELDPQLTVAYSNYALALAMIGEFDKAEKELKKAVILGYKNGNLINERINNLKELED